MGTSAEVSEERKWKRNSSNESETLQNDKTLQNEIEMHKTWVYTSVRRFYNVSLINQLTKRIIDLSKKGNDQFITNRLEVKPENCWSLVG